jgi:transcriptional regulator with XRE-family HTH domain
MGLTNLTPFSKDCRAIRNLFGREVTMPEASRLLTWCAEHGLTITDVAGLSGYSVPYLSLISRGKRTPPPHAKVAIARAVGARVGDLFTSEERAS